VSPNIDAKASDTRMTVILREPRAANAPAAKSNESPGRNGVMTKAVSKKMIVKRMMYVQRPYCCIRRSKWTSMWSTKSMNNKR